MIAFFPKPPNHSIPTSLELKLPWCWSMPWLAWSGSLMPNENVFKSKGGGMGNLNFCHGKWILLHVDFTKFEEPLL